MKTNAVKKEEVVVAMQAATAKMKMEIHPSAAHFPDLPVMEFLALKADILKNGQLHPIVCLNGKIVDGRQRYRALTELEIEPIFVELGQQASAEEALISHNLLRRHLTESQRAMIGAKLVTTSLGSNQSSIDSVTQGEAAKRTGVSADSIARAAKVLASGDQTLIRLVERNYLPVNRAANLARLPVEKLANLMKAANDADFEDKVAEVHREAKAAKDKVTMAKVNVKRDNNQPLNVIDGEFGVIYIDPPWDYLDEKVTGYPTMSREELLKLEVGKKAAENAACFMWVPASQLPLALELMAAYGFEYKTHAVWDKELAGTGVYFRARHELLLLGTRGTLPEVHPKQRSASVFAERRRDHSRKPNMAYHLIEQMYPELPKLEMFCRGKAREGWVGWGNECIQGEATAPAVGIEQPSPMPTSSSPLVAEGIEATPNPDPIVAKRRVGRPSKAV